MYNVLETNISGEKGKKRGTFYFGTEVNASSPFQEIVMHHSYQIWLDMAQALLNL
jgi:hypothetical protein